MLPFEDGSGWIPFERDDDGDGALRIGRDDLLGTWRHFVRNEVIGDVELLDDGRALFGVEARWELDDGAVLLWFVSDGQPGPPLRLPLSPDGRAFAGETPQGVRIGCVRAD